VVNQSGTITVLCTNGTTYNVGLDAGTGTGATVSNRKMSAAGGGT
jgi:spore coat protein U-like protein